MNRSRLDGAAPDQIENPDYRLYARLVEATEHLAQEGTRVRLLELPKGQLEFWVHTDPNNMPISMGEINGGECFDMNYTRDNVSREEGVVPLFLRMSGTIGDYGLDVCTDRHRAPASVGLYDGKTKRVELARTTGDTIIRGLMTVALNYVTAHRR